MPVAVVTNVDFGRGSNFGFPRGPRRRGKTAEAVEVHSELLRRAAVHILDVLGLLNFQRVGDRQTSRAIDGERAEVVGDRLQPIVDLQSLTANGCDSADQAAEREFVERLYSAIRELPKADAALVLLYLDGLTYRQIAEVLGISENNVGVKLSRARQALTRRLAQIFKGEQTHYCMTLSTTDIHRDDFGDQIATVLIIPYKTSSRHALKVEDEVRLLKNNHIYAFNQRLDHALIYSDEDTAISQMRPCSLLNIGFRKTNLPAR